MRLSTTLRMFTFVLILTVSWACKSSSETIDTSSSSNKSGKEELYWARVDSAKMQFTEADAKFMSGMIGHHAQAIVMSRLAPKRAESQQVKTLAKRIINSQKDEINSMQQWLRERNQPVPEIKIDGIKLTINGMLSGHMKMAGMLSQDELKELKNAEGTRFDRLFLSGMIGHHKGAVVMVDNLLKVDGAAQEEAAFKLASNINADQQTEIARMKRLLNDLTAGSK